MWEDDGSELKLSSAEKEAVKISSAPKTQRCPYFLRCGGCQLLNWDMTRQLAWKQEQLKKLFSNDVSDIEVLGAQKQTAYRHKNSFSYQTQKYITTGGFFKQNSRTLLPIEHCLIQHPIAEAIFLDLLKIMKANRIEAYDDGRNTGTVRHALVRVSHATNEVMLVLVTALSPYPGRKNFLQAIRKAHPEITTIVENIQKDPSPYLLGQDEVVAFGKGFITENLLGKDFHVSARTFFQVHPEQAEVMFKTIMDKADLRKTDTLVDVYSGVGVIGILLADQVQNVISVESNQDASNLAKKNADLNKISNIRFVRRDATEWIMASNDTVDVIVMDPPREGASAAFMQSVKYKRPRTIIYISCNPISQKRDIEILKSDYVIESLFGVDLFPHTVHVESVCILKRKA